MEYPNNLVAELISTKLCKVFGAVRKKPLLTDTMDKSMKPAAAASLGAWVSYTNELTEDELRMSAAAQYAVIYTDQLKLLCKAELPSRNLTAT